ncbi:glycosyltransferase family 2 protein [Microbacterium mangrovi]|uniref:glycosyltransferase family 2 protein n=1 Tax=Microbacterium mangrovi TaxID=1348253 RepID=UPI000690B080|nr:glycosyltransferase family A protein [Microbacterium mangrovi]
MATADLVTVVIPSYNGRRFIHATLDSILAQTHPAVHCIVVDDGSTDDTVEIVRAHPLAPTIIQQPNLGVAVARNRGLAAAAPGWVAFLDQDDLWHRDRLASLVAFARAEGASAVASSEHPFAFAADEEPLRNVGDGRDTWPRTWIQPGEEQSLVMSDRELSVHATGTITVEQLLGGAAMLTTCVLYDRDLAISAGGCAPHARALDDHVLNLNVARITGGILRIDTQDVFYRVHPASTTTVSPMVGPFLSTMAAMRLGGVFPDRHEVGPNVQHLLFNLAYADLTLADQLGLLALVAPPRARWRWFRRWLARRSGLAALRTRALTPRRNHH